MSGIRAHPSAPADCERGGQRALPPLDVATEERTSQSGPFDVRPVLLVAPQPFYENRGTPIALLYVLNALSQLGRPVDMLTLPLGQPVDIPGVRICRTGNPLRVARVPVGFSVKKVIFDLLLFWNLRSKLRAQRYGYVHAVEEGAFLAALLCRRRDITVIYDMASSIPEQLAQKPWFSGGLLQLIARPLERWLLRKVDYVVCSAGLAGYVRTVAPCGALREWRFPATPPSTSPDELGAVRSELGLPEDAQIVLYSGNFAPYQGIELLFEAAPKVLAAVPNAVIICVGASREDQRNQRIADSAFRDRVLLLPRQPRDRMAAFTGLASVLVSPRSHGSNFPLKIFDYLAAGKPIVATDVPAHRAVLDDTLALLVPSTAAGMADGLIEVLRNRELAERLGAAGADYARLHLTWPSFVRSISEIYGEAEAHRTLRKATNANPHKVGAC